ncbi:MAG: hypothetical protein HZB39_07255 [Planctomycetes bacterium]|nr:hypothetical protein [Planctomycetota bacterium]
MKLEPVYLLAPEPEAPRPRGISRRVLFLATAAACGLGSLATLGVQRVTKGPGSLDDSDEAFIRLAERLQDGPIDGLMRERERFLFALAFGAKARARLAHGSRALASHLLAASPSSPGSWQQDGARALLQALCIDDPNAAITILGTEVAGALRLRAR